VNLASDSDFVLVVAGWPIVCIDRTGGANLGLLALARLNPGPVEDAAALRHALSQSLDDDATGKTFVALITEAEREKCLAEGTCSTTFNMYQSPLRSAKTSMDHWLK
jgi:hypothetical protein